MKLGLHLPINTVSFGQVSLNLLRTIYDREKAGDKSLETFLFTIGQVDLGANDSLPADFPQWLNHKIIHSLANFNRDIPIFKLWHLNGSLESFSKNQTLFSFYELDKPTPIELNIAKANKLVFSSQYSCDIFKVFGVNTHYLPMAFDSYSFGKTDRKYHTDGRIVFNICGKYEKRKQHSKMIKAWIKRYGNNPKYSLQCSIYNPFLVQKTPNGIVDLNGQIVQQLLEGKPKPFNVEFLPNFKENSGYNDLLNSGDIILGMSGGEGWGLPEFQSVALGKHAVILNAHGYKSWANDQNAVLVNPSGKISAIDGAFFREGDIFNQGNIFDWNEEDFLDGCEKAIKRFERNPVNTLGLELQKDFSKERFLENVIKLTCEI